VLGFTLHQELEDCDLGSHDVSWEVVVSRILIAGRDWQSRTLLRAQLLEEGFEVDAYEIVSDALSALTTGVSRPELLIADVSSGDDPSADLEALSAWSSKIPMWIIASRAYRLETGLLTHGFEIILLRSVDIGELVDRLKQRLAESG
jgi:hypothetical protein